MPGTRQLDLPAVVAPAVVTWVGDQVLQRLPRFGPGQRVIAALLLLGLHQAMDAPVTRFLRQVAR
jgi:hypothetical protein